VELDPIEQLATFVEQLRIKGVRSYKGELVLSTRTGAPMKAIPIEIEFERPARGKPEND